MIYPSEITKEQKDRVVDCAVKAFTKVLSPLGFRKSGSNWRAKHPDIISVVNIPKSNWGFEFYVNVGVFFRNLAEIEKPREYECQVRARMHPKEDDKYFEIFEEARHYDGRVNDDLRFEVLEYAMTNYGLPFFRRFENIESAKTSLVELPTELSVMITQDVYKYYGITRPDRELSL